MDEWQPIRAANIDGTICDLRFCDPLGYFAPCTESGYFLHDDGYWYLVDPPTRVEIQPTHWRPKQ